MKVTGSGLRLSASDVANFLACQHLTRLDLLAARGELKPPREVDVGFLDLVARGEAHEQTVLAGFRVAGLGVAEIAAASDAEAARATVEAIRGGTDVIYQGVLLGPPGSNDGSDGTGAALLGRPDFLIRAGLLAAPDGESRPAEAHYEVVDAKLARSAKGRAVAQTTFYTRLLTWAQGVRPRWMHLALGHGELASFKVGDYAAYERQTRRVLAEFIAADPGHNPPGDPYPEPVEHCAICRWSPLCASRRRRDDDLSLIAGVTADQRRALKAAGVLTRRAFARQADLAGV
ncbi:MAG: TM0106 family RecB-like putative nuclease, partial [Streptosporangiaceae bacterium]